MQLIRPRRLTKINHGAFFAFPICDAGQTFPTAFELDQGRLPDRHLETRGWMTGSTTRRHQSARLSVILLSTGPAAVLEGAIARLLSPLSRIEAHLVVVRSGKADFRRVDFDQIPGSVAIQVPANSSRHDAIGLAMPHATGDIVVIRDDTMVADAEWVHAFRDTVRMRERELHVQSTDERSVLSPPSADRRGSRRTHSRDV